MATPARPARSWAQLVKLVRNQLPLLKDLLVEIERRIDVYHEVHGARRL
jgi:hypothetical protein